MTNEQRDDNEIDQPTGGREHIEGMQAERGIDSIVRNSRFLEFILTPWLDNQALLRTLYAKRHARRTMWLRSQEFSDLGDCCVRPCGQQANKAFNCSRTVGTRIERFVHIAPA